MTDRISLGQIDFESVPGFSPEPLLFTNRVYPCGCSAFGPGDVPNYCSEHGAAQQTFNADFDKARNIAITAMTGIAGVLVGWILAKIF